MHNADRWRRAGLLLLGVCCGLLLLAIGVRVWLRGGLNRATGDLVETRLGLPAEAFEWETVPRVGAPLRGIVRDVTLLDRSGDTIAAVPRLRFVLDPTSLAGTGPVVLRDVEIINPLVHLAQSGDGAWNLAQVAQVQAAGEEVEAGGRGVVLRDVRVVSGRATVRTPELSRTVLSVDARLPLIRYAEERWRVELASFNAALADPALRVVQLRGFAESAPGDRIRFAIREFRTERSRLEGTGTVRLAAAGPQFDLDISSAQIDFRDLAGLGLEVPEQGQASFALRAESLSGGRTRWAVRNLQVASLGSEIGGTLTAITGGPDGPEFGPTRLTLNPLDLATLDALGFGEQIPFDGTVRGTVASNDGEALRLDLVAALTPEGGGPPSTVAAEGEIALGEGTGLDRVRLQGLRVTGQPLNLATFASLFPERRETLRGIVTGGATLTGTAQDLRITGGDLEYTVGDAAPTRLADATGRIRMEPQLQWEFRARAEPLSFETLTELFPSLPLRPTRLTGPIALAGTADNIRFNVDLAGEPGGIAAEGRFAPGTPARFEIEGRLQNFRADRVVTGGVPAEGPLSGRFAADGTTQDFRFDVDLTQQQGRFALQGRVRQGAGSPEFEIAGRVSDFQLGALIGRPNLFPSPLTGPISIRGGGQAPYRFDVDLRGAVGVLDLEGWYQPGTVPSYAFAGQVAGLDLRGVVPDAPASDVTATLSVQGRGLTPETFQGRVELYATASSVAGVPLEAARIQIAADGGILRVDTLALALEDTRLNASGTLGLTRPAPGALRFNLVSEDISELAAVIPPPGRFQPQLAGALTVSGTVDGTLRTPEIVAALEGRNLVYQEWRADSLGAELRAERVPAGWVGSLAAAGRDAVFPGGRTLEVFSLKSEFTPERASVGLFAGRDPETSLAASAVIDLVDRERRGIELESLALRLGTDTWRLAGPTRIRGSGPGDFAVERLVLRREGPEPGFIEVDGGLAPSGPLGLRVRIGGVDLADVRRLFPTIPEVRGDLAVDALLSGTASDPEFALTASVDSLLYGGANAERFTLTARYADGRALVDGLLRAAGTDVATLNATLPMQLSLGGMVPEVRLLDNQPLNARVVADSLPLGLLTAAIPGARDGEGLAAAQINVSGTPADPLVRGNAWVSRGALTVDATGTRYTGIEARLGLAGRQIQIDTLLVRSQGTAQVTGTVILEELTRPRFNLLATFSEFQAIDKEDVGIVDLDGRVALRGQLPEPILTGQVRLSDADIFIPEISERAEVDIAGADIGALGADTAAFAAPTGGAAVLAGFQVQDLQVAIGDNVWLRSPDADVQLGGEVQVSRVGGENRIRGTLEALRGTYQLQVGPITREFEIVRGTVQFFGTPELNPALNIVAANEVRTAGTGTGGTLTVLVQIGGTLQNPTIQLTSDTRPPLPESEILNYLAFGRSSTQLGAMTGGLAQDLLYQEVVGGAFANLLQEPLLDLGLFDYVRVRSGTGNPFDAGFLGSTTVEAGKGITRDLYLTVSVFELGGAFGLGNTVPKLGVGLDYQIDPQTSVRAAVEPVRRDRLFQIGTLNENIRYQGSLDVRRRWEYGRPRDPAPIQLPPRRPQVPPTDTIMGDTVPPLP